ncbi:MAG: metallophosphoesterase family protein [Actinomycetota bacterium]|nr:metallophosphoesterase family protein [Actinomycetota bacterium]
MSAVRTAIISDLHLGAASEADLLRRPDAFAALADAVEGVDRLVLLGDVLEFRDRPFTEAMELAKPALAKLAALSAGEVIVVPGNHDYRLISSWLEARALRGAKPLGLSDKARLDLWPASELRAAMPEAKLRVRYPGVWLREDVYATHGHYLDRHLTIPTFERLGLALVERTLGLTPAGDDPLAPPDVESSDEPEEYERVAAPVFAFLYALAQAGAGANHPGGTPTRRIWDALTAGSSRSAKLRGWLLGSVALPGAVGAANRLGLGPVRADLSPNAITRAGVDAMSEVVERLRIDAGWVLFGHTHRRGPLDQEEPWVTENGATLLNTGSWVHSPSLLRSSSEGSAYWPGTVALIEGDSDPELVHLLDDWTREDLAG